MTEEQELHWLRAAKADPQCFGPLYDRYFGDVFRFLLRRAGDRDLTADLTQQTFLKALLALERYEPRGLPFRAWLFRIALNELRMHWRKKKEVLIDLSYTQVRELSTEMGLSEQEEDLRRLAMAMGRLDEARTHLLHLRYMDGLSYAEMGHVLGLAEDAAKMRVHRIIQQLRTYLAPKA
jgi:RNA polymerase sigma-70 factor (ECF subfamily)